MRLFCLLFAFIIVSLSNSWSQTSWEIGPHFSNIPWKFSSNGSSILLSPPADNSPVPSTVHYASGISDRIWSYGIIAKPKMYLGTNKFWYNWGFILETSFMLQSSDFVNSVTGGPGAFMNYSLSERFSFTGSLLLHFGYMWGYMGEVGTESGDYYLEAPDGSRYDSGSDINITKWTGGAELLTGVEINIAEKIGIRLEGGYRYWAPLNDWNYEVVSGDRKSELPSSGFSKNPPVLDLSGAVMRITLLYSLKK